jgi:flagellar basal-body rod modification protein FlgD
MTDISGITGTSAAATSKSKSSLVDFSNNFDSFLTLLTQQLKNQDPLKPMDSTEFTTQLVQFTGVEQSIRQNSNLEQLISLQGDVQAAAAVNYIGKAVSTSGNSVVLANGSAGVTYSLQNPADKAQLQITDSSGNVVRTTEVDATSGTHTFAWDGRGDTGNLLPDGTYSVKFTATTSSGSPVSVLTGRAGVVTNTSVTDGKVILTVHGAAGDTQVPLSDVTSVGAVSSSSSS